MLVGYFMLVYKQFSGIESLVKKMVDISIKKKIATSIVEMTGMDQEYRYILVVDDNEGSCTFPGHIDVIYLITTAEGFTRLASNLLLYNP